MHSTHVNYINDVLIRESEFMCLHVCAFVLLFSYVSGSTVYIHFNNLLFHLAM